MTTQTVIEQVTESETEFQAPSNYRVILHNDDKTTYQFVIFILQTIFDKGQTEAQALTDYIHNHGSAVVGIYSFQIAETKAEETISLASANGFPLLATIEEV